MKNDTKQRIIAIDIDDVTADTLMATKTWAELTGGVTLEFEQYHTDDPYWDYYNSIWKRHGYDSIRFETFLEGMAVSQKDIPAIPNAARVIKHLNSKFGVVFITSRIPTLQATTREWIDEHIDPTIPLYLAHNPLANQPALSKGELCTDLGIKYLIDDNIGHCEDVEKVGVQPILFGNYGWNRQAPESLTRCVDWRAVEEYFDGR